MKLCCGIDQNSSNCVVAGSDEQDRPLYEKRLTGGPFNRFLSE